MNEGLSCIELTGRFFASTTQKFHQETFLAIKELRGLYHCTRLDAQITVLNPEVDALGVVQLVEDRCLWPVGFGRGQAYCERKQDGEIVGPVTQYFGAPSSRIRARCYDKQSEAGWPTPAVRYEVQMRREPADQWSRRLFRDCETERDTPPLLVTAESRNVRNIVGSELDLRDTSAWKDRDLPQRWAQYAPTPGWWQEAIGQAVDPLAVQYRRPVDLTATLDAGLDQYGRKAALELTRRAILEDRDMKDLLEETFFRGVARWRQEDQALLLALVPEKDHGQVQALYREFVNAAAKITEMSTR